ncbi:MFS transporter [Nafulsella turpanensis]|uniref:MFS transporter n=1 Tax=Nafulsella turpanensis TaxID=1265690 RepID=UPI0003476F77|nr:MFS transporter [Nafulsella turpanensis]
MKEKQSIYTLQFILLCLSTFLFFSSFNLIIPELPNYLQSMGGGEYIGLIIGLFTLTAGISRPFSGKLADTIGRIPVMIFGATVCFIMGFMYPLANTVAALLAIRLLHGFSTGFTPTGTSAYVADVVPASRRGEAMGMIGLSSSLGMACGPAIGSTLANVASIEIMFYASSGAAILSVLILSGMKESLAERQPFHPSLLKLRLKEIFEPAVLAPCVVLLFTTFSFGAILTLSPEVSDNLGLENRGIFFMFFTIASVAVRFFAGKVSDTYGRIPVLRVGAALLVVSMLLVGFAQNTVMFLAGGVLFGLSTGVSSPTVFAWTIDLSHDKFRGRGLATMYISLELGIGLGALFSGWIYGGNPDNFAYAFGIGALLAAAAFVYLLTGARRKQPSAA